VDEQAQAKHARSCFERFPERDEHRDRLARARDDDALALVYTLEQLRQGTSCVIGVVLGKRLL
jgi:hypothetical protein